MKAYIRYAKSAEGGGAIHAARRYYVEIDGFTWRFAELPEMQHVIDVLSQRNLPPSPPKSWLSKLPGWVKTWKYRQKAMKGLCAALKKFLKNPDDPARIPDARREAELKDWGSPAQADFKRRLKLQRQEWIQQARAQLDNSPRGRRARRYLKLK